MKILILLILLLLLPNTLAQNETAVATVNVEVIETPLITTMAVSPQTTPNFSRFYSTPAFMLILIALAMLVITKRVKNKKK